ncbi:MAG: segregation ATPase FtsK/SpoIIIE, family [Microbacteriaceae bacterium]|nr:segregation ATPase FtsK/SpoIIIE, family [Microbacteriaceae bacterium]
MPPRPAEPVRAPFPLVASVAPVAASAVIWAITQSPFALVFAALSPIVAIASLVDGRRQSRRSRRRAALERAAALARLRAAILARHELERAELARRFPSAAAVLAAPADDVSRWRANEHARGSVGLGVGSVESGLRLTSAPDAADADEEERELRALAAQLPDAVVVADAALGVGVVGRPQLARALARGYLLQLAHTLSPASAAIETLPPSGWEWAVTLPHIGAARDETIPRLARIVVTEAFDDGAGSGAGDGAGNGAGEGARKGTGNGAGNGGARDPSQATGGAGTTLTVCLAERIDRLPAEVRTIVRVDGPGTARIIAAADGAATGPIGPELVSSEQAATCAAALAAHARASGAARHGETIPVSVAFSELTLAQHASAETGLAETAVTSLHAPIGLGERGVASVDLVTEGPHAVVGGTTGSGKSELLVTWVTSMAAGRSPDEVTFLLVDFKGGAAFAPLTVLPHCVGVVTDLDDGEAERALESLRAELRFRERMLADLGARDIADAPARGRLARLVIVVDEFAAMVDTFPDLHTLFVDVAARGRSLGVHLVLCTQRPSGVVRDALLANCGLRLSLRVHNGADSLAVIGTTAAAALPAARAGLCIVARDGRQRTLQVATTSAGDIQSVARGTNGAAAPRRPWLDPLPPLIPLEILPQPHGFAFALGVEDVPSEQRQQVAVYRPERDGGLVVLGAHGTGKSTVIASIARQCSGSAVSIASSDLESAWDALRDAMACCSGGADAGFSEPEQPRLVLVDDLDSLHARIGEEYQQALIDMIGTLLRDGPAARVHVVATAQRLPGPLQGLLPLFGDRLILRMSSRQEHVLAGGEHSLFDGTARPGAGTRRGRRVQLASSGTPTGSHGQAAGGLVSQPFEPPGSAPPIGFSGGGRYLLISRAPVRRAAELRAALGETARVIELGAQPINGRMVDPGADELLASDGPVIVVGDPDAWQAQWTALSTLRARATLIFDGCSLAEVRLIARRRELPPLLGPGRDRVWLCDPEGRFFRASLSRGENGGKGS